MLLSETACVHYVDIVRLCLCAIAAFNLPKVNQENSSRISGFLKLTCSLRCRLQFRVRISFFISNSKSSHSVDMHIVFLNSRIITSVSTISWTLLVVSNWFGGTVTWRSSWRCKSLPSLFTLRKKEIIPVRTQIKFYLFLQLLEKLLSYKS